MGSLLKGLIGPLTSAVSNGAEKGITSGFNNIGHTVNVWVWSLPFVLLLFLLFGNHFGKMLTDLVQYLTGHSAGLPALLRVVHPKGTPGWSDPWTPTHTLLTMHEPPVWTVLVAAIWALGILLGVFVAFRGGQRPRSVMLWAPLATGIFVFATPSVLPPLLRTLWGAWGPRVSTAIASSIGAAPSALQNPFWIWGAIWGLSGPSHVSLTKIGDLIAAPGVLGVASGVAHALTTAFTGGEGMISGQLSIYRDVANFVYQFFNVGILLMVAVTVAVALWTLLLVGAGVWLGIAPVWAWIAVLDPWSPEAMWAVLGVAARAFALQLGAWIWVGGIAAIDGGPHGPLGLSPGFVGLAPWLSLGWTVVWIVVGWRGFAMPAWLLLRHVQIDLANWWTAMRQNVAVLAGQAGDRAVQLGERAQTTGQRLEQLGVILPGVAGDVVQRWGTTMAEWGESTTTAGAHVSDAAVEYKDRAAWRGAQAGWRDTEITSADTTRMGGSTDSPFAHPAGWAVQTTPMAVPDAAATVRWQETADGAGWQGTARSPSHAAEVATELHKTWAQAGLADDPMTWRAMHEGDARTQAAQQAQAEVTSQVQPDGTPLSQAHPQEIKKWVDTRAKTLAATILTTEYSDDRWAEHGAMPLIHTNGAQVSVQARSGAMLPPTVATTLAHPTTHHAPLTRQRYGRTEELRQGVWVAQSSKASTGHLS
ncbi:hypothetical protein [Sulfobacillus sp. hq2]|uniref:hypothetical protein n=1 Tax=Sulfobacillus TaxID=28033 RepID=UPI000CD11791|nr:hypothetical protein [Sulfobacillus sp. hq2]POB09681.1 hypothetical protein CO251_15875 [Sulfobacillus sp. hq2]